jgi:unsaturated rhamnogalacturonyl hydrolase
MNPRHLPFLLLFAVPALWSYAGGISSERPAPGQAESPARRETSPGISASSDFKPQNIAAVMAKVAQWQLAHPGRHSTRDWTQAALYVGMAEWAGMAGNPLYYDSLLAVSGRNKWRLGDRPYHADDHSIGWTYLNLYDKFGQDSMIAPLRQSLDWLVANPSPASLQADTPGSWDRWCWCDALFMSPPVLARLSAMTGDPKYREFANREWWATTAYLYDQEEHLFFRDSRYFAQRENNGAKIFWTGAMAGSLQAWHACSK